MSVKLNMRKENQQKKGDIMLVRKHFIVSGDVQGVGFRHRAAMFARRFGLTGYVRNLGDGSVEMELQGEGGNIGELIYEMEQSPFIQIGNLITDTIPVQEEADFRII